MGDDWSGRFAGGVLLEREDVVQHPLHPPALEPMAGDEARMSEELAELEAEACVNPQLAPLERLFEKHQALVEDLETLPPVEHLVHRLKTDTLPPSTLTRNWGRGGTSYLGSVEWPAGVKLTLWQGQSSAAVVACQLSAHGQ